MTEAQPRNIAFRFLAIGLGFGFLLLVFSIAFVTKEYSQVFWNAVISLSCGAIGAVALYVWPKKEATFCNRN